MINNDNNDYAKVGDTITFNDISCGFRQRKLSGIIEQINYYDDSKDYHYCIRVGKRLFVHITSIQIKR